MFPKNARRRTYQNLFESKSPSGNDIEQDEKRSRARDKAICLWRGAWVLTWLFRVARFIKRQVGACVPHIRRCSRTYAA